MDNDKDYRPDNCKWATYTEQYKNKRSNGWNKLTKEDARKIRADPRKYYEIAKDYNVTRPMIGHIKQGKSFSDVDGTLVTRPRGNTKLTDEQIAEILMDPRQHWKIAESHGVSRSTISRVKRDRRH
jgi:hypothetical protein